MADVTPRVVQPLPAGFRHLSVPPDDNTTAAHPDFAQSYAILIGVNDYANGIQPLATATHDAEVLAELLAGQHGYQVQRLTTAVSKAALTELFTQHLPATVQANDRLLVYFAGHGIALDGDDGPAGYLIPQDARPEAPESFLAMRDFNQWLSQLRCRHLLVILDCCFAGAFRWASTRSLKPLPDRLYRERFDRFIRDPAWQVLTSAAYDQKALDFLTGNSLGERGQQNGHSPFAQALFAALAGKGDLVPAGGDGVITATELYLYLRDSVEVAAEQQARHRQTPGLWPLQKHDKGEFIFFVPGQEVKLEAAPTLTAENNPYRGLASYDYSAKDARLFFGRNKLIDKLATLVEQHGLTFVLGASGTGKSSLVKAGLLPKLHPPGAAGAAGEATWQVLPPMRPTDQPLRVLHHLLTHKLADGEAGAMPADLSHLTEALVKLVHDWCQAHAGQRLLLMVDQLEELITLCRNDAERTAFLDLLALLLHSQPDRLRIVLTLRSDFEPQFAKSPLFTQPTQPVARFIVPPLSQDELREVIEGPAAASTLFFEESQLIDDLINEVVQMPGALPLLSFTLEQLYLRYLKRQETGRAQGITIDRSLICADYKALGGVIGSLNRRASEEYNHLPDDAHRVTLQRVMLRMVAVEGGELARRRVALQELEYSNDEENRRVAEVIKRLVDARLLVAGVIDADGDGVTDEYVEPAHDALVRAWDQLYIWQMEAERKLPLALRRELTQAANNWNRADAKDKLGLLWDNNPWLLQLKNEIVADQDERLDILDYLQDPGLLFKVIMQVTAKPTQLNRHERAFVKSSVERRTFLWRRLVTITLGVIIALASLSAVAEYMRQDANIQKGIAIQNEAQANRRAAIARAYQLVGAQTQATQEGNSDLSLILAKEAVLATWTDYHQALKPADIALRDAISSNLHLPWRMTLPPLRDFQQGTLLSVDFSSDGKTIATTDGQDVRLWDAETGSLSHLLVGYSGSVAKIKFSANDRLLFTEHRLAPVREGVSYETVVRLWDVETGRLLHRLEEKTIHGTFYSAEFSPDSKLLVAGGQLGAILIWDVTTGQRIGFLEGHTAAVEIIQFSADGQLLLSGSQDGTARLWNLTTGQLIHQFVGIRLNSNREVSWPTAVKFSPDDKRILTSFPIWRTERDASGFTTHLTHQLKLWDSQTGQQVAAFDDYKDKPVEWVDFSPSGSSILVQEQGSRIIQIRDIESGRLLHALEGHTQPISTVEILPDGNRLVTVDTQGTLRLWEIETGKLIQTFELLARQYAPNRVSYLPSPTTYSPLKPWIYMKSDGNQLLIVDAKGLACWWNVNTNELPRCHNYVLHLSSPDLSVDGQLLVAANTNGSAELWDLKTKTLIRQFDGHQGSLNSVRFSPDSKQIVTAGGDGTIRVWEAATGQQTRLINSHLDFVAWSIFSSDGRQILAAGSGGTAQIWNIADIQLVSQFQSETNGVFHSFDVTPDNKRLVTIQADRVRLWGEPFDDRSILLGSQIPDSGIGDRPLIWERDLQQFYPRFVRFSDNGKLILLPSAQTAPVILDAATGQETQRIKAVNEDSQQAVFSPGGRFVLLISGYGMATIWDVETGLLADSLLEEGKVQLWSSFTPGNAGAIFFGQIPIVRFSPDGEKIYSLGADGQPRLWNVKTGKQVLNINCFGHDPFLVFTVGFTPDLGSIITSDLSGSIQIGELRTEGLCRSFEAHRGLVDTIYIRRDGKQFITTADDGTAKLWNMETNAQVNQFVGYRVPRYGVRRSPNGQFEITAHPDPNDNLIILDTATLKQMTLHLNKPPQVNLESVKILSTSFSPDSKTVVTSNSDGTVSLWRTKAEEPVWQLAAHSDWVNSAQYSSDGKLIATTTENGTTQIWNANTGQRIHLLQSPGMKIKSASFDPSNEWIVTASSVFTEGIDGIAEIWDVQNGRSLVKFVGHKGGVRSARFSPDGSKIVTAGTDHTVRIWNAKTGQQVMLIEGHMNWVNSAKFSEDGEKILTASSDRTARIWNAKTGELLHIYDNHTYGVSYADISRDGKYVVTAGDVDGMAYLWDEESGELIRTFAGHTARINYVVFSSDDKHIATASDDQTIRIWDVASGQNLRVFEEHTARVNSVNFSPDGKMVISASSDKSVRIWLSIESLLKLSESLSQREPPLLTYEEKLRLGLDE